MAPADSTRNLEWELQGTRPGSSGFLKIETRSYRMPDGQIADWDVIRSSRTVAMVAITVDGKVLLARQFRPGPGRVLLELPGGGVDEDEDVLAAAHRELLEETGHAAGDVRLVGHTWLAAYSTAKRHAVIATGCHPVPEAERTAHPDELEFIQPVLRTMDEFRAHVSSGQLTDTDIAFMCLNYLGY